MIGSVLFIYANGALILGLIGVGVAVVVLVFSAVYTLRNIVFIAGCDTIIRKVLIGQLTEPAQIDEELDTLIQRAASRSALSEGRRIVRGTKSKT